MAGKEILARIYTPKDWIELPDGSLVLLEREVERGSTIVKNRRISFRNRERTKFHSTHRVGSAAELAAVRTEAGLAVEAIHGGLDGNPSDRQARRVAAVERA